jgi:prophage antirepressor-like protein
LVKNYLLWYNIKIPAPQRVCHHSERSYRWQTFHPKKAGYFAMNNLAVFQFDSQEIRFAEEKPVANDVAKALGFKDPANAVSRLVKDKNKGVCKIQTPGGIQSVTVLEEAGIYQLIFSSRLPSAEKFQDWVFEEVLPAIRKTGTYSAKPVQELLPINDIKEVMLAVYGHTKINEYLLAGAIANEIGKQRPEYKALTESIKQDIPGVKVEEKLVRPGKLAEIYETKTGIKLSAQKMNTLLAEKGLQTKNDTGNPSWLPTEEGEQYSQLILDTAKGHNKTVQSLQWYPSVIEVI